MVDTHPLAPDNVFQIQTLYDLNQDFERQRANNIIHGLESNLTSHLRGIVVYIEESTSGSPNNWAKSTTQRK